MFTAIDIGNSTIKLGIFENDRLTETVFFKDTGSLLERIKKLGDVKAAISSVVPEKTKIIAADIKTYSKENPHIITHKDKFDLKFNYKSFNNLGLDRICSAEGAYSLLSVSEDFKNYNSSEYILIIDFGTATTLNIIEYPGTFIGGIIAPGIKTMIKTLKNNTALLPGISTMDYLGLIGNDTKTGIASGVINSTLGLIEKTLNHLTIKMSAKKIYIFITGGNAESILEFLDFEYRYEIGLVLYGIKRIFDKNNPRSGSD